MITFFNQLPKSEKKKFKLMVLESKKLNKDLAKCLIKPLDNKNKVIDKMLKSEISLEEYQHKIKNINKWIEENLK